MNVLRPALVSTLLLRLSNVHPGTAPSPRTLLCGADTVGSVLYVFGGGDQGQQPYEDFSIIVVHRFD